MKKGNLPFLNEAIAGDDPEEVSGEATSGTEGIGIGPGKEKQTNDHQCDSVCMFLILSVICTPRNVLGLVQTTSMI